MYKILISILLVITTFSFAKDDTYVFEAKGAFAKDLKALVEKYSKDGKVEVKVYKKSDSIVSSILEKSQPIQNGKALYTKRCASCHGQHGEVAAGAGSRILKNMSADEITEAVENYKRDEHFGGSMKMLMQDATLAMRSVDLTAIVDYIKDKTKKNTSEIIKSDDRSEEKSSYLQ
ncbi:MAG: cytochrome c [Campylobacteraceae bacterium]|nr:cytochrome c [Campylobacteraceae bacterium]